MHRSRIGLAITSLALTAGAGLTACSHPAPAPTPGPSAGSASSPAHDAPAAAPIDAAPIGAAPAQQAARPDPATPARPDDSLTDGRHPARITAVDPDGEQVTIDVVQFFFGEAATEAARADGSTDLPPPNDHWIRNVNPRLRSLPVAPHAPVMVNILSSGETGDSQTNSTISLSKLASYGDITGAPRRRRDRHRPAMDAVICLTAAHASFSTTRPQLRREPTKPAADSGARPGSRTRGQHHGGGSRRRRGQETAE